MQHVSVLIFLHKTIIIGNAFERNRMKIRPISVRNGEYFFNIKIG